MRVRRNHLKFICFKHIVAASEGINQILWFESVMGDVFPATVMSRRYLYWRSLPTMCSLTQIGGMFLNLDGLTDDNF